MTHKETYRHNVFVVGSKSHAVDAIFMSRELGHTALVLDIPDLDRGKMAAFSSDKISPVL